MSNTKPKKSMTQLMDEILEEVTKQEKDCKEPDCGCQFHAGGGKRVPFASMIEAKMALDTYIASIDDFKVGDYVVLSKRGKNALQFPNMEDNQIGRIVEKAYTHEQHGGPMAEYVVAIANAKASDTGESVVLCYTIFRWQLEKYDVTQLNKQLN